MSAPAQEGRDIDGVARRRIAVAAREIEYLRVRAANRPLWPLPAGCSRALRRLSFRLGSRQSTLAICHNCKILRAGIQVKYIPRYYATSYRLPGRSRRVLHRGT